MEMSHKGVCVICQQKHSSSRIIHIFVFFCHYFYCIKRWKNPLISERFGSLRNPGSPVKSLIVPVCIFMRSLLLTGLVHVGDELREVNGVSVIHKRPDEISQLLVRPTVQEKNNEDLLQEFISKSFNSQISDQYFNVYSLVHSWHILVYRLLIFLQFSP